MESSFLSHLAEAWAYVTLGASGIITEEAAPIIGGFAAYEGHLGLKRVILACSLGTWLAAIALYGLGRWRGKWVRKRFPKAGRYMTRLIVFVRRSPWKATLAVRWAFGIRIVFPVACGAARLRLPLFLFGSAIACVTWSAFFALVGWIFGETAVLALGHLRRYEDIAAALIVLGVILVFVVIVRRRRAARLASESGPLAADDA